MVTALLLTPPCITCTGFSFACYAHAALASSQAAPHLHSPARLGRLSSRLATTTRPRCWERAATSASARFRPSSSRLACQPAEGSKRWGSGFAAAPLHVLALWPDTSNWLVWWFGLSNQL